MTLIRPLFEDLLKPKVTKNYEKQRPVGTCSEMCSKEEVDFRIKNKLIHPMETETPFVQMKRSERRGVVSKMVKEYSRPAADKKLNLKSIRPFPTLMETVDYLLTIYDTHKEESQWLHVYTFVSDRFRAIRHDMIVQQLDPPETVKLLEPMIPFYLKSKKRCEILKTSGYDKKLHSSELDECFSRWISAAKQGAKVDSAVGFEFLI